MSPGNVDQTRNLATITRYYDGCSLADVEMMESTLHPDAVHYFLEPNPGCKPVYGGRGVAAYWARVQPEIAGHWIVDHIVSNGDEAVVEWSLFWTRDESSPRVVTRGSEWFVFEDGLIVEIRSYYQQLHRNTGLKSFGYEERGYAGLGQERSKNHAGVGRRSATTPGGGETP